jgi:hypothetical protein
MLLQLIMHVLHGILHCVLSCCYHKHSFMR